MYFWTNVLLLITGLAFAAVCYRSGWAAHYGGPEEVPPHLAAAYQRARRLFGPSIGLNIGTLLFMAAHVLAHGAFAAGAGLTPWAFWIGLGLAALASAMLAQTLRR